MIDFTLHDIELLQCTAPTWDGGCRLARLHAVTFDQNDDGRARGPYISWANMDKHLARYHVLVRRDWSAPLCLSTAEVTLLEFTMDHEHLTSIIKILVSINSAYDNSLGEFISCFSQSSHMKEFTDIIWRTRAMADIEPRRREFNKIKQKVTRMMRACAGIKSAHDKGYDLSVSVHSLSSDYAYYK